MYVFKLELTNQISSWKRTEYVKKLFSTNQNSYTFIREYDQAFKLVLETLLDMFQCKYETAEEIIQEIKRVENKLHKTPQDTADNTAAYLKDSNNDERPGPKTLNRLRDHPLNTVISQDDFSRRIPV